MQQNFRSVKCEQNGFAEIEIRIYSEKDCIHVWNHAAG